MLTALVAVCLTLLPPQDETLSDDRVAVHRFPGEGQWSLYRVRGLSYPPESDRLLLQSSRVGAGRASAGGAIAASVRSSLSVPWRSLDLFVTGRLRPIATDVTGQFKGGRVGEGPDPCVLLYGGSGGIWLGQLKEGWSTWIPRDELRVSSIAFGWLAPTSCQAFVLVERQKGQKVLFRVEELSDPVQPAAWKEIVPLIARSGSRGRFEAQLGFFGWLGCQEARRDVMAAAAKIAADETRPLLLRLENASAHACLAGDAGDEAPALEEALLDALVREALESRDPNIRELAVRNVGWLEDADYQSVELLRAWDDDSLWMDAVIGFSNASRKAQRRLVEQFVNSDSELSPETSAGILAGIGEMRKIPNSLLEVGGLAKRLVAEVSSESSILSDAALALCLWPDLPVRDGRFSQDLVEQACHALASASGRTRAGSVSLVVALWAREIFEGESTRLVHAHLQRSEHLDPTEHARCLQAMGWLLGVEPAKVDDWQHWIDFREKEAEEWRRRKQDDDRRR